MPRWDLSKGTIFVGGPGLGGLLTDFRNLELRNDCKSSKLTDEGLRHLRKLTKLEYLYLGDSGGGPGITDAGLKHTLPLDNGSELHVDWSGPLESVDLRSARDLSFGWLCSLRLRVSRTHRPNEPHSDSFPCACACHAPTHPTAWRIALDLEKNPRRSLDRRGFTLSIRLHPGIQGVSCEHECCRDS